MRFDETDDQRWRSEFVRELRRLAVGLALSKSWQGHGRALDVRSHQFAI